MIDTHVNYHAPAFDHDRAAILERARNAGVRGFMAICDRLDAVGQIVSMVSDIPDMLHSVGVHPHHAKDHSDLDAEKLHELCIRCNKLCALGETGLDYHKNFSPRQMQMHCFEMHIEAGRELGLPIIIHCRDAETDMAQILEKQSKRGTFTPLMHCYTGSAYLADLAADMGACFSVSGIASFKNANPVRQVIAKLPPDRIVIETDSPYLAPVPMRGKRNEPAFLQYVCSTLADILHMSVEETAALTTANANRLFAPEDAWPVRL